MICLLKNLKQIGKDTNTSLLPESEDITPAADLSRVKYYRNYLAHVTVARLENQTFLARWNDISDISFIDDDYVQTIE